MTRPLSAFTAALLWPLVFLSPPATAADTPPVSVFANDQDTTTSRTYWRRNREGWFWYRDPPDALERPTRPPAPPPRPRELTDFDALQKTLEDLKRVAVMNPTDANLLAYMRFQRFVMDKSQHFAERWQRLVWTTPDLDYGLTGRPTNGMAVTAFDEQQRDRDAETVRTLATTHGLLFVFRSDCPYCHRFAPILKRFEQQYGITVLAISLDGGSLPDYPNPNPDNGIAARLNTTVVPALYLTAPAKRDIRPVGFGVMATNELVERIAALARSTADHPL